MIPTVLKTMRACIFQMAYGTGSQWASEDEVHWTF